MEGSQGGMSETPPYPCWQNLRSGPCVHELRRATFVSEGFAREFSKTLAIDPTTGKLEIAFELGVARELNRMFWLERSMVTRLVQRFAHP